MFRYIWIKEMKGELFTWKSTLWLIISSLLLSFTSYSFLTNKELCLLDQTEMLWLLGEIIVGTGLLIVAIDASSTVTGELENETVESLFLSPMTLCDFVLGKFLACLTLWGFIFIVSVPYMLVTSAGSRLGSAFISYVFLLGTLVVIGFILLVFTLSFLYRSSKNTLTTSLIILMALAVPAVFSSTLKNNPFGWLLSKVNPVDNAFSALDNVLVDGQTALSQNWPFLLPLLIFCLLMLAFMAYSVRCFSSEGIIRNE